MSSTAKPCSVRAPLSKERLPSALAILTIGLTALLAIPMGVRGGTEAILTVATGAGISLGVVLVGLWLSDLIWSGNDPHGTKAAIGGFIVRFALLLFVLATLGFGLGIDVSRFLMWLVTFYFVLIMAEAVILARDPVSRTPSVNPKEGTAR